MTIYSLIVNREDIREFCEEYNYKYSRYKRCNFLIYWPLLDNVNGYGSSSKERVMKDLIPKHTEYYNGKNQRILRRYEKSTRSN